MFFCAEKRAPKMIFTNVFFVGALKIKTGKKTDLTSMRDWHSASAAAIFFPPSTPSLFQASLKQCQPRQPKPRKNHIKPTKPVNSTRRLNLLP